MDNDVTGAQLLDELDNNGYKIFKFVDCTKEIFGDALSTLKDHFVESAKVTKKTKIEVYIKILYARCINDLISGFHLAIHGYTNQFFAITRSILENLDLINLLDTKPDDAKRWLELEEDSKRRYDEFRPVQIRKKLDHPTFNEMYGHWCEMGSHPSSKSFDPFAAIAIEEGKPNIVEIQLGSTQFFEPILFSLIFSYLLLIQIEASLIQHLPLSNDVQKKIIMKQIKNFEQTISECLEPEIKKLESDVQSLGTLLDSIKELNDKISKSVQS